ncbi:MAG TPA: DUF3054 domain-containing protein, partial [Promineifilum sp.]|nr:DUF3054 domain-containing protein [Promineifilum sp.]
MTTNNQVNTAPRASATGQPWWLLAGDWLVLLLFVFIGQRDHGIAGQGALASLLSTTISLVVAWTAVALVLGGYRLRPDPGWRVWLGRVANIWLVAAPLGLVLRALLRGQDAIPVIFILVALSIGGLMMVGWRAAAYWWLR